MTEDKQKPMAATLPKLQGRDAANIRSVNAPSTTAPKAKRPGAVGRKPLFGS